MKISILLPGNTNRPTGGYKVIYEYCNKLLEYGHDVFIYYYYGAMFDGLHIPEFIRRPLVKKFSEVVGPGLWFKLDRRIKKRVINSSKEIENSDVVIATAIDTAKDVMELPHECGKKVYFIQGFENWNCSDEEVFASYNFDMTNVVVANWLKKIVDAHTNSQSYLVSNCINTEVFYNKGDKRRRHSIVFHYRTAKYKGAEFAFEAIRRLEEKYNDLYVNVISIERRPDNLPKCCTYHRKISAEDVAEINNHTEVFMCTSIEEGFGLPGLEAMACGCAVVSTSYRGVLEYAVDGENALLSPVKDVDIMVKNIEQLFEDDKLRNRIAENGIQTGKERALEKSAKEFERLLIER